MTGWRDIASAPRDGTAILAAGLDGGEGPGMHVAVVRWRNHDPNWEHWECDCDGAGTYGYLTLWMPLPPTNGYTNEG